MGKFYAVKVGRETGIFNNWLECEKQVKGFSGASYKSFATQEEAESFLKGNISSKEAPQSGDLFVYVDGSYSKRQKKAGFGCVFVKDNKIIHKISQQIPVDENEDLWNVSAEIAGALNAVEWSIDNKYSKVNIFYDYEGLEKWYSGEWKASKKTTKEYVEKLNVFNKYINISFFKVKAHSGDVFNEQADQLAKDAIENDNQKEDTQSLHLNTSIQVITLKKFNEIVGNIDQDKIQMKFNGVIWNDNAISKIAKYFWKKEKRKVGDLDIKACLDANESLLELVLSDKKSEYKICKMVKIEGE
ncbi:ribonuclease H family protein [Bacillus cereus]|uniref:ribonuclease H family protein n=1 Tax=Bacillus cereus group TaxID=86661 RepID=UPI002ED7B3EB|nr:ribonuclease H family protein [Bacillus cereus]